MAAMIHTDFAINRVRSYLNDTGIPKSRLALEADVPEGCVRNVHDKEWNPTIETLRKLEGVIPENFVPKKLIKERNCKPKINKRKEK